MLWQIGTAWNSRLKTIFRSCFEEQLTKRQTSTSFGIQDRQTIQRAGMNGSRINDMTVDTIADGKTANGTIVLLVTTAAGGNNENAHEAGGEQIFNLIENDGLRHLQEAPEFRGNAHPTELRRYLGAACAATHHSVL